MPENEKLEGQAEQAGAGTPSSAPDLTDEEELDIEIERAAMRPKRGAGGLFWTLLVIVAAVIVLLVGLQVQKEREEEAQKQRQIREAAYAAQEKAILSTIERAAQLASKGEISMAFDQLRDAEEKWAAVASEANSNVPPDVERAQYANGRRDRLKKALAELEGDRKKAEEYAKQAAELEAQARELAKKRDELNNALKAKILELTGAGETPEKADPQSTPPATP